MERFALRSTIVPNRSADNAHCRKAWPSSFRFQITYCKLDNEASSRLDLARYSSDLELLLVLVGSLFGLDSEDLLSGLELDSLVDLFSAAAAFLYESLR